jgi:hypothetical protein
MPNIGQRKPCSVAHRVNAHQPTSAPLASVGLGAKHARRCPIKLPIAEFSIRHYLPEYPLIS